VLGQLPTEHVGETENTCVESGERVTFSGETEIDFRTGMEVCETVISAELSFEIPFSVALT
jgi:hypothetical protein